MSYMSPAEAAAIRQLLGVSAPQLAELLGNNVTAIRQREAGSRGIPEGVAREMRDLVDRHTVLVRQMVAHGGVVEIPYKGPGRGWHLGAAARALAIEPDLMVEWALRE